MASVVLKLFNETKLLSFKGNFSFKAAFIGAGVCSLPSYIYEKLMTSEDIKTIKFDLVEPFDLFFDLAEKYFDVNLNREVDSKYGLVPYSLDGVSFLNKQLLEANSTNKNDGLYNIIVVDAAEEFDDESSKHFSVVAPPTSIASNFSILLSSVNSSNGSIVLNIIGGNEWIAYVTSELEKAIKNSGLEIEHLLLRIGGNNNSIILLIRVNSKYRSYALDKLTDIADTRKPLSDFIKALKF